MQRVSFGYTIVETMIFLAVSVVLLGISGAYLHGSENHNRFAQSMRDMQSKMEDWINDVSSGFPGGTGGTSGQSHCFSSNGGNNLRIDSGPANPNNPNEISGDCIFLGKVIQFTDTASSPATGQDSEVFAYSVFGRRSITPPGEDERPVADLLEAQPFPAVGVQPFSGSADLTETYHITGGTKVKKIISSSGLADSHLGGFFLTFNQPAIKSNGSTDLRAYQYPIPGSFLPGNQGVNEIDKCISLDTNGSIDCRLPVGTPEDQWPPALTSWQICFYNDNNDDQAVLTISSSNGEGVTTKMEQKQCP